MPSPGEQVREFYRRQGEQRERERILAELKKLENYHASSAWSPKYILSLIANEDR
jgi:hypothetical protein